MERAPSKILVVLIASVTLLAGSVSLAPWGVAGGVAVPAGWKQVTYRGVTFDVPSDWPVYDLSRDPGRCVRFDVHAVYLGIQGPNAPCPARLLGKTDAIQVQPLLATTSQAAQLSPQVSYGLGQPAYLDPNGATDHDVVAALLGSGVLVTASYSTGPALDERILRTFAGRMSRAAQGGPGGAAPTALAGTPTPSPTSDASSPTPKYAASTFTGYGFDTCSAPSTQAMTAWLQSPFRMVGIYVGGANRACGDGNLSASWVTTVESQGWNLAPLYVGLQAPCVGQPGLAHIQPNHAVAQGRNAADDAVARAKSFGLGQGTPIYFDMEAYNDNNAGCVRTTMTFLESWTNELHTLNYVSGVYGSSGSTIRDLAARYTNSGFTEPDDIWFANWDLRKSVLGDPYFPDWDWPNHQRIHQYKGGHNERYGGVTLNIDSNYADGLLANSGVYSWSVQNQAAFTDATRRHTLDLTKLDPGDTAWLVVTAKNTGSATWYRSGPAPVQLGTWSPANHKSRFATPWWLGPGRPTGMTQQFVGPGKMATFDFPIRVPSGGGTFAEHFNLVARGITWMVDAGLSFGFTVHVPAVGFVGSDSQLYAKQLGQAAFEALGGSLIGPPAVVTYGGDPYYIAEGGDHVPWVRTDTLDWQPLGPHGTYCGSPAAYVQGSTLTVACRGPLGGVRVGQAAMNKGSLPSIASFAPFGGLPVGGASVAPIGSNINFFDVQKPVPNGHDVYRRTVTSSWMLMPYACHGRPAVGSNGHMTYFACNGPNHQVWWMRNPGTGWTAFRSIGGLISGSPSIAVAPDGGATVFAMTPAHGLMYDRLPMGTASTWTHVGATATGGVGSSET